MTKDDLVTEVVKSCKGDELSKRLVSDVIDATFASIGKSINRTLKNMSIGKKESCPFRFFRVTKHISCETKTSIKSILVGMKKEIVN